VLDERGGLDPCAAQHVRVDGAAEGAALVHMRRRPEQQGARNTRNTADLHKGLPPYGTVDVSAHGQTVSRDRSTASTRTQNAALDLLPLDRLERRR